MADVSWYGATCSEAISEGFLSHLRNVSAFAQSFEWDSVFTLLENEPEVINIPLHGNAMQFALLHHAASAGVSIDVVDRLTTFGAWRTLENAHGERPIDVAERMGYVHLLPVLEPALKHKIPYGVLGSITENFHKVIHGRVTDLCEKHELRLPQLAPLLELNDPKMWFPIPGMYGGFSYWFENDGADAKLISESWSRMDEGSGQRHDINSRGYELTDEGFV